MSWKVCPAVRSCGAIFERRGHVDFTNCVAAWLSRDKRVYPRIQTLDRHHTATGARELSRILGDEVDQAAW